HPGPVDVARPQRTRDRMEGPHVRDAPAGGRLRVLASRLRNEGQQHPAALGQGESGASTTALTDSYPGGLALRPNRQKRFIDAEAQEFPERGRTGAIR